MVFKAVFVARSMMFRVYSIAAAAILAMAGLAVPAGASLVIDDFNTDLTVPSQTTNGSTTIAENGTAITGVIDGYRQGEITKTGGTATVSAGIASGALTFSTIMDTTGSVSLLYDGMGSTGLNGGGGLDVTSYLNFVLDVTAASGALSNVTAQVTLFDTSNAMSSPTAVLINSTGLFSIPLSLFVGIDKSAIRSIQLTIAKTGGDFGSTSTRSINSFILDGTAAAVVPEPTSFALIGMALVPLGLAALRRRSRRSTAKIA
jgi:hypothetical protein